MIFVDSNVFMYAVGGPHPLKREAVSFFRDTLAGAASRSETDPHPRHRLCTSAEVLQELLHAYLPVGRLRTLESALELVDSLVQEVWAVERDDILLAGSLHSTYPHLQARDLVHLACCRRHGVTRVQTYDRALASVFSA